MHTGPQHTPENLEARVKTVLVSKNWNLNLEPTLAMGMTPSNLLQLQVHYLQNESRKIAYVESASRM